MKTPYLDKRIKMLEHKVPDRFAFMKEERQKELSELKAIKQALSKSSVGQSFYCHDESDRGMARCKIPCTPPCHPYKPKWQ